jgi:hypothetical protein
MMHLVTNLVVSELNLTCIREMKQQLNDKVEHSTIHPDYLLVDLPFLMVTSFFLTQATYSIFFEIM